MRFSEMILDCQEASMPGRVGGADVRIARLQAAWTAAARLDDFLADDGNLEDGDAEASADLLDYQHAQRGNVRYCRGEALARVAAQAPAPRPHPRR